MGEKSGARTPPTYDLRALGEGVEVYERLDLFADEFVALSEREVGPAFANVPGFLAALGGGEGREAEFYRRTTRERYYLELLACVVMARQFWPDFKSRKDTVLILPDCLRIRREGCKRKRTRFGQRCSVCHPGCLVGRMTALAERYGAGAYFSDMDHPKQFKALRKGAYGDLSVIGVACVWMLAQGMRAAEAAGIPSQGVLLNYCGCEHWTGDPFTTDAAVERVEEILKAKKGDS